jgi:hypothetical protein
LTRRNASLKPQLNQIRSWVQEGATDIWIAHKLGSTPASISRFRRQHDLRRSDEPAGPAVDYVVDDDLDALAPAAKPAAPKRARREPRTARPAASDAGATVAAPAAPEDAAPATDDGEGEPAKRRRGRRGGRGRSKGAADGPIELEAVFDHGDEGYGLWLDGAVREAGVYRNHWQGHADIVVRITADEIVIRRAGEAPPNRS